MFSPSLLASPQPSLPLFSGSILDFSPSSLTSRSPTMTQADSEMQLPQSPPPAHIADDGRNRNELAPSSSATSSSSSSNATTAIHAQHELQQPVEGQAIGEIRAIDLPADLAAHQEQNRDSSLLSSSSSSSSIGEDRITGFRDVIEAVALVCTEPVAIVQLISHGSSFLLQDMEKAKESPLRLMGSRSFRHYVPSCRHLGFPPCHGSCSLSLSCARPCDDALLCAAAPAGLSLDEISGPSSSRHRKDRDGCHINGQERHEAPTVRRPVHEAPCTTMRLLSAKHVSSDTDFDLGWQS